MEVKKGEVVRCFYRRSLERSGDASLPLNSVRYIRIDRCGIMAWRMRTALGYSTSGTVVNNASWYRKDGLDYQEEEPVFTPAPAGRYSGRLSGCYVSARATRACEASPDHELLDVTRFWFG